MGRLSARRPAAQRCPRPGELLAVEALDRSGAAGHQRGGAGALPARDPQEPAGDGRHRTGAGVARVRAAGGARGGGPVAAVLCRGGPGQARRAARAQPPRRRPRRWARSNNRASAELRDRGQALRRLHDALEESLELHADEQAAVELGYYVVVPFVPDQGRRVDWRELIPGRRGRLPSAPLARTLESHRRLVRESLRLTDAIRADLEALDLSTRLLSGPEVADLLWRRFNPTSADRTPERRPGAGESRLEVLGELDAARDAREAAQAARALRELVAASAHTADGQRQLRIDRDLEQTLYVATPPDATYFGWLLEAMEVSRPFALCVHVHALDRLRERARHKARHRRLFGVNRGAELRGPRRRLRDARPRRRGRRAAQGADRGRARRGLRAVDLPVDPRTRPRPRPGAARRGGRTSLAPADRRLRRARQPGPAAPARAVAVLAAAGPRRGPADAQVRDPQRRRQPAARGYPLRVADRDPVRLRRARAARSSCSTRSTRRTTTARCWSTPRAAAARPSPSTSSWRAAWPTACAATCSTAPATTPSSAR